MDLVDLNNSFLEFEKKYGLMDEKIDGVYFWERVRFQIHKRLRGDILNQDATVDENSDEYLRGVRLFMKNIVLRNPFFSKNSSLLFYGTGRRKKYEDGLWWDIYHDTIIESIEQDSLLWERPYNVSHFSPPKSSNLKYVDLIEYTGTLLHELGLSTITFSERERSLLKDIENELRLRFGVDIQIDTIVQNDLSKRRVRLPLYRKALQTVDPKMVFLTVSYNGRETFVEACQLENIPTVELQHGVHSEHHFGYSYPNTHKHAFPDYFFAFGKYWRDTTDLPMSDENIYSIGYPHLQRERKKFGSIEKKDQIVIISQSTIGKELSKFAVDLEAQIGSDQTIVYKLHPKEFDSWQQDYPWLADSELTCITDGVPLYELFAESTTQIGVYSTALYEGFEFDLETYIVELPGHEYMSYLIENDHVVSIRSVDELLSTYGSAVQQTTVQKEYFFEQKPIERFEAAVEEIASRENLCNDQA